MSRIGPGKWMLPFGLAGLLVLGACNSQSNPDVRSTQSAQQGTRPEPDIRSIVRRFLATMPADWNLISPSELAKSRGLVVDVRQPEEYATGSIEGALNVPLRGLLDNLQVLPETDSEFVLVCDSGHRSAIGMAVLQMLGYQKAKSLAGGLRDWRREKIQRVSIPAPQLSTHRDPSAVDAQLRSMLGYYLTHTLPVDWGVITPEGLTEDQKRKSSIELDPMAETFDQGRSALIVIDDPIQVVSAHLNKAINLPLRRLPDGLGSVSLEPAIHYA